VQPNQLTDHVAPGLAWGLPFLGVLLSIALGPILAPRLWHRRADALAAAWCVALLLPQALVYGPGRAAHDAWHAVLVEYLPFVTLLLALFVAGGGILLSDGPWGTPAGNTLLLAIGMVLAGLMGTTGAAMVLVHPLLRANAHRRRRVHLVIFFIVLVANVGGATTPLGDPPLYIGFLHGVPFAWPLLNLGPKLALIAAILLPAFYVLDRRLAAGEPPPAPRRRLRIQGWSNVVIVIIVALTVLAQGVWHPGDVVLLGQKIGSERVLAMAIFLAVAVISMRTTRRSIRQGNLFNWDPIVEVATLFAAIFITITPVMAMLAAGFHGPLAPLLRLTLDRAGDPLPLAYFWLTGVLSAFLDNAPTYLVFFELAGGDPVRLTGTLNSTLAGIAGGAVFFGALTYIGNAPNMMVRSIASHRGVRMPSFFAFIGMSAALMLPVLVLVSVLFF
jgi:Na+/H+ antiporter NhaD/arsenite permease-like protein